MSQLAEFIAVARKSPEIQKQLEGCSLDDWGDAHTPLDIDQQRVIDVAHAAGFVISRKDLIQAQCEQLNQFWRFEMENSFVARRYLARVQYQLSGDVPAVDYYS